MTPITPCPDVTYSSRNVITPPPPTPDDHSMCNMLNKSENQILNPHFRKLHFSNLQPFRGIVNGTSQKKQPFQGRRISRMPKNYLGKHPKIWDQTVKHLPNLPQDFSCDFHFASKSLSEFHQNTECLRIPVVQGDEPTGFHIQVPPQPGCVFSPQAWPKPRAIEIKTLLKGPRGSRPPGLDMKISSAAHSQLKNR